ncbi:MAG: hypothetical protein JWP89_2744 [Schlesneria sp.]|nr:hypothetical protein [Schlesneria sp.]
MTDDTEPELISQLPSPQEVRAHLGVLLRHLELIRKLLRLAERREKLKTMAVPPNVDREVPPDA